MASESNLFCVRHSNCVNQDCLNQILANTTIITSDAKTTLIQEKEPLVYTEEIKAEVVKIVNMYLAKNGQVYGKDKKLTVNIELFDYLTTPKGLIFVNANNKFKQTVIGKLIQYIEKESFPQFIPYYEKITGSPYILKSAETKKATLLYSKIAVASRSKMPALIDYYSYLLTTEGQKYLGSQTSIESEAEKQRLSQWILEYGYHQLNYYYQKLYGTSVLTL